MANGECRIENRRQRLVFIPHSTFDIRHSIPHGTEARGKRFDEDERNESRESEREKLGGASGRTRTGTPLSRQRILSPQRLPIPPPRQPLQDTSTSPRDRLRRGRISAVDDQTREYLDRLLAETREARRELGEKFEKNTDRLLTVLDRHSKQLGDLSAEDVHAEIRQIRAQLAAAEERLSRIESLARRDHDA